MQRVSVELPVALVNVVVTLLFLGACVGPSGRRAAAGSTPTPALNAVPTPAPTPAERHLAPLLFGVNSLPAGCHASPNADASLVAQTPPGTVHTFDLTVTQVDGTWNHNSERLCWVRTDPGSLRIFQSATEAESFGRDLRQSVGAPPPPGPSGKLEIQSWECSHETFGGAGGYAYIQGEVKNATNQPLRNVTAVASWYTADDQFIRSDDALTEFNPILPGQVSPFKTISTYNPAMKHCRIAFKELGGGTISAVEKGH